LVNNQQYDNVINKFLESGSLYIAKTGYLELPELEVQDIDNEEDWKIAEVKFNFIGNS